jgi:hypothetical protein
MKTALTLLVLSLLVLTVVPGVLAANVGSDVTPDIETEDFEPRVFMCDGRAVLDDQTEPGRVPGDVEQAVFDFCREEVKEKVENGEIPPHQAAGAFVNCVKDLIGLDHVVDHIFGWEQWVSSYWLEGTYLWERFHNYAFEGEQIVWDVLIWDKNGIEKVEDVFATIGSAQGAGNDIEVNCIFDRPVQYFGPDHNCAVHGEGSNGGLCNTYIPESCNARELEEELTHLNDNTAAFYKCIFTVETPDSMYGEYWITVEATDLDGLSGTMAENEYWFLNPVIALSIDGGMTFDEVRPGTSAYSETLLVGNDADAGSGVMLDMFISGTDFYDSSSSGAKCPISNQLELGNGDSECNVGSEFGGPDGPVTDPFCYFASQGAYSTQLDHRSDAEGYVGIDYGIGFNDPNPFYGNYEIIHSVPDLGAFNRLIYQPGNILSPGSEIAVTFRLNLPEPCNGDFDSGSIFFWGEAI